MATVEHRAGRHEQVMSALALANRARLAAADVKAEIRTGRLSVAAALEDERSGPLTLLELLTAQHRWGRDRVMRLLKAMAAAYPAGRLSESKRVRELTARQRRLIASWCEPS